MAKKSTGYISKGERRNVSRKLVNLMKQERKANPPVTDVLKRMNYREEIISKPRSAKQRELCERYVAEDRVELQAYKLFDQYREVNIPRSTVIQAVKTNYIEQLHAKWGPILKAYREEAKNNKKL